jgi:hypothetical protein
MVKDLTLVANGSLWSGLFLSASHAHHDDVAVIVFAGFAILNWGALLGKRVWE